MELRLSLVEKHIWLTKEELSSMFSSEYWNNAELEKNKIWGMWDVDFKQLEKKFLKKGLLDQFLKICSDTSLELKGKKILSLGSGISILEANILKLFPEIDLITNVELSEHRVFEIAPEIFGKYNINSEKYKLCLGSFLNLKIEDESQDIVLMSQAFHHSNSPEHLLLEVKRVLKPSGNVIIIGEHYFDKLDLLKRIIKFYPKYIINHNDTRTKTGPLPTWRALYPVDEIKGDHHYNQFQYKSLFKKADLSYRRYVFPHFRNQGFIISKSSS